MTKIQNVYTKENDIRNKRKKIIKNSTYALIATLSIMLGATLVAVNLNSNSKSSAIIQTSAPQSTSYSLPLQNAVILKDYNAGELQYNDTLKQWEIHKAVDLVSETSSDVLAVADGTVTNLYTNYLEGTVIEISHKNGLVSVYKSLNNDVTVSVGNKVSTGQIIGSVSETMAEELNVGAHLHLEMFLNGVKVNPNDYLDLGNK